MERPGLLEFALYAVVIAAAGAWVYALPPFTYWQDTPDVAQVELAAATSETAGEQADIAIEVGDRESAETETPEITQTAAAEPEDEPEADLLVVTARSLNMRAEPNARSRLLGSYPRGSLVEKVETSGNWVRVRSGDDTGWMYSSYLAPEG